MAHPVYILLRHTPMSMGHAFYRPSMMFIRLYSTKSISIDKYFNDLHDIWTIRRLRQAIASLHIARNLPVLNFSVRNGSACHQLPQKYAKRPLQYRIHLFSRQLTKNFKRNQISPAEKPREIGGLSPSRTTTVCVLLRQELKVLSPSCPKCHSEISTLS